MNTESENTEFKSSWRDEYLKWLCGFANAQGGTLYIGINDSGVVCGVHNANHLMEILPNLIRDTLGIIADINLLSENGKEYIQIRVDSNPYPVNYKGEYHYRSGTTKQELKGNALNRFLLKKTGLSWDSVTIADTEIKTFRNDGFDIFREQAQITKRMNPKDILVDNTTLAEKLNLIESGQVSRAGVLLFHHNPEKWITGSWIKIGYFANDADILYQDEVHGSLFQQVKTIIDLLYVKYLTAPITYNGITRVETYPYPKEAVREAVLNAIVHKNYASLTPIQIRVYPDKLRIANDSILPDNITPDMLLNEGKSRPANPKIANAFYRAGFIEAWGRGIQEIRSVCQQQGNPEPEFRVSPDAVYVTFYPASGPEKIVPVPEDSGSQGGSQESSQGGSQGGSQESSQKSSQKIMALIEKDNTITTKVMAEALGISRRAVAKQIQILKKEGLLQRIGPTYGGHWKIVRGEKP